MFKFVFVMFGRNPPFACPFGISLFVGVKTIDGSVCDNVDTFNGIDRFSIARDGFAANITFGR